MTSQSADLDRIRRDIDRIDERLHDLLMERAALVDKVAKAKAKANTGVPGADQGVALRPGREAHILRRLAERHQGRFPLAAMVRIWREIMGTMVGLQHPFSVAVCQPERGSGYLELARDQFGVVWPKTPFTSPGQVVRAVADGQASVGVVPLPGDHDPWWLSLTAGSGDLPQIVTRLPVLTQPPTASRPEPFEAYVIANCPHDDTGADRTLVAVETAPDVSRDRLRALCAAAGLEVAAMVATHRADDHFVHLCEIDGHAAAADPRLVALAANREAVRHLRVIGGYPLPLTQSA